jgi:murein DD-endopeptidase MepM/ murein hydrolase activator NlpD
MDYPAKMPVIDLSEKYDPEYLSSVEWGIGKYNEKRLGMYTAPQYRNHRNIHMGIDIWAAAGSSVYTFWDGVIAYMYDHRQDGNYGPTIVTRHMIEGKELFALYGHLSRESLRFVFIGQEVVRGQKIAELGVKEVNGGWAPHLHFQLSVEDPGEADMPGVIADEDRAEALRLYPDPRMILGKLY